MLSPVSSAALLVILLEAIAVFFVLYLPASVSVCEGFISLVAVSFVAFLFTVARKRGLQNIFITFAFVFSNIASIILAFGSIYSQLGLNDTVSKKHTYTTVWDGIYFSIITLTTVGYGDITPNLQTRSIAAFEALTGYVIMGLLISVLVIMAQRMGGGR